MDLLEKLEVAMKNHPEQSEFFNDVRRYVCDPFITYCQEEASEQLAEKGYYTPSEKTIEEIGDAMEPARRYVIHEMLPDIIDDYISDHFVTVEFMLKKHALLLTGKTEHEKYDAVINQLKIFHMNLYPGMSQEKVEQQILAYTEYLPLLNVEIKSCLQEDENGFYTGTANAIAEQFASCMIKKDIRFLKKEDLQKFRSFDFALKPEKPTQKIKWFGVKLIENYFDKDCITLMANSYTRDKEDIQPFIDIYYGTQPQTVIILLESLIKKSLSINNDENIMLVAKYH